MPQKLDVDRGRAATIVDLTFMAFRLKLADLLRYVLAILLISDTYSFARPGNSVRNRHLRLVVLLQLPNAIFPR